MFTYQHTNIDELREQVRKAKHVRKKIELSITLCNAIIERNTHGNRVYAELLEAIDFAKNGATLASQHGFADLELECIIAQARCIGNCNNFAEAISTLESAQQLLHTTTPTRLLAQWHYTVANQLYFLGEYSKAIHHYTDAMRYFTEVNNTEYIEYCCSNLGASYREINEYSKAFQYHADAIAMAQPRNSPQLGGYYVHMAADYFMLANEPKGFEYLNLAEDFFIKHQQEQALPRVYINRAAGLSHTGKYYEALQSYFKALDVLNKFDIHDNKPRLLAQVARTYEKLQDYDSSLLYFNESMMLAEQRGDKTLIATIQEYVATLYIKLNKLDEAERLLKAALYFFLHTEGKFSSTAQVYKHLSEIAQQRGKYKTALEYYQKYHEILEIVREHERAQANKEAQHRLEVERAAREREELKIKAAELERSLEMKQGELTSLAIALSQKNELIEKLRIKVKELSESNQTSKQDGCKTMIHEIEVLRQSSEEQWTTLQKQFESIDSGYQNRLLHQYPALTQYEIKVCLLMKLNLSTKDIASILWTSPRTVETQRYSIRKKLNLNKDENLYSFLVKV